MRLGFNFVNGLLDTPLDDLLTFSAQYGATDVVLQSYTGMDTKSRWAVVPGDNRWELRDLERLRNQVESHGIHLEALEPQQGHGWLGAHAPVIKFDLLFSC